MNDHVENLVRVGSTLRRPRRHPRCWFRRDLRRIASASRRSRRSPSRLQSRRVAGAGSAPLEPVNAGRDVDAQQKQPPEQGAILATPQRGQKKSGRHRALAVASDVANAKVVADVRQTQNAQQHQRRNP